jgi:ectoine hydroxylase-related dioxygenase (phytanoyl-CoA dioxygenase family)
MEIGEWRATRDLNDVYRDIRSLVGFTVIEDALAPELTERLREAIVDAIAEKSGRRPDPAASDEHPEMTLAHYLLFRDRAFEEAVLNPPALALITYLLGKSCLLSSMTSHFKGPGRLPLGLHSDNGNMTPNPLPPYALVANCNYALTDYTGPESGAFAIVPGSHKLNRHPTSAEARLGGEGGNPDVIPVVCPAGSAIVFHGNAWHGSYARSEPGFRINLAAYFCRRFVQTQERFREAVPAALLDRNPPRFATLMGMDTVYGYDEQGPDFSKFKGGAQNLFA